MQCRNSFPYIIQVLSCLPLPKRNRGNFEGISYNKINTDTCFEVVDRKIAPFRSQRMFGCSRL